MKLPPNLFNSKDPQMTLPNDFTDSATAIEGSEGAPFLFQKQGVELRYIYSTTKFTTSIEAKPVFPSLDSKKVK